MDLSQGHWSEGQEPFLAFALPQGENLKNVFLSFGNLKFFYYNAFAFLYCLSLICKAEREGITRKKTTESSYMLAHTRKSAAISEEHNPGLSRA